MRRDNIHPPDGSNDYPSPKNKGHCPTCASLQDQGLRPIDFGSWNGCVERCGPHERGLFFWSAIVDVFLGGVWLFKNQPIEICSMQLLNWFGCIAHNNLNLPNWFFKGKKTINYGDLSTNPSLNVPCSEHAGFIRPLLQKPDGSRQALRPYFWGGMLGGSVLVD